MGTNFHGGGQNMDGNNCPKGRASCDRPFRYSPLLEIDSRVTAAAPLFYGMLLVSRIGAGDMLSTTATPAARIFGRTRSPPQNGSTVVVIVNSEASKGVNATVDLGAAVSSATAVYLRGPSLTATSGVTLGEALVDPTAPRAPRAPFTPQSFGQHRDTSRSLLPPPCRSPFADAVAASCSRILQIVEGGVIRE